MNHETHLQDLRKKLKLVVLAAVTVFILSFYFSETLISLLNQFYNIPVMTIQPYEMYVARFKVSAMITLILCFPLLVIQGYRFLKPGLTKPERKMFLKTIPLILILTLVGGFLGATLFSKLLLNFLALGNPASIPANWALNSVIGFVTTISIVSGGTVNFPVIVYSILELGLVSPDFLRDKMFAIGLAILVLSAVVTPPDPVSMLLVSAVILGFIYSGVLLHEFI